MRLLGGKPLLYYVITAAQESPLVDEIYVSTDDENIAAFAKSLGASVPFLRNTALSSDTVHGTEPVLDMLRKLYPAVDDSFFCLRLLAPYPFLSSDSITNVVQKSHETGKNVLSVLPLDINMYHLRTLNGDGTITPITDKVAINFQIDDAPRLFALSGAAQCMKVRDLLLLGSYQKGTPLGYSLKPMEGFELDTLEAFTLAEDLLPALLKHPA